MKVSLQHTEGSGFVAQARQHRVALDQPAEDGASDRGMTPSELFLAALGGCIGQYVAQYLRLRALSTEGLLVHVEAELISRPQRLAEFRARIVAPGLTERQLRALEKTLPSGLVQNAVIRENALQVTATAMQADDVNG